MDDGTGPASRVFHDYTVVAKDIQSEAITSFTLARADGGPVPAYKPGQYLVFRLPVGGGAVLRNYSLSGDPADPRLLRVAVKREPAPPGQEVPAGQGSNHLHDAVHVGDTLVAAGPMGDFVLDESSDRPVVLFSGGVGLTPMMAMLYRLAGAASRRVYFIHACENGRLHAFVDEVLALAARRPGITAHFCYRNPSAQDIAAGRCHSQGLVTRTQLQALLPLDDYDVYLCGPGAFMQANWALLRSLGVARKRIHYEFFGPATVLDVDAVADTHEAGQAAAQNPANGSGADAGLASGVQVRFLPSGKEVAWDEQCGSLLALAEQAGLQPDFNCRAGLCNTCMSRLVSGEVAYDEPPLDEPPEGRVLICCARPVGPVEIELGG